MTKDTFEQWLNIYGDSWETKNADKFVSCFTADAKYYRTPFDAPAQGKKGIAEAFSEEVSSQDGINFEYQVIDTDDERGICRWWCSFTRIATQQQINLDGIFLLKFGDDNHCSEFNEWWHTDEFM